MDDAIVLRAKRGKVDQKTMGMALILQSPQIDREPISELELLERAYKRALHTERKDKGKRRPDDRMCVVCGDWRPLSKFDEYEPGHHLAICRPCAATSGQKRPMRAGHKQCATCFQVKPLEAFGVDREMQSGRQSNCYVCEAERKAAAQRKQREHERQKLIEAGQYRKPGRPPKVA